MGGISPGWRRSLRLRPGWRGSDVPTGRCLRCRWSGWAWWAGWRGVERRCGFVPLVLASDAARGRRRVRSCGRQFALHHVAHNEFLHLAGDGHRIFVDEPHTGQSTSSLSNDRWLPGRVAGQCGAVGPAGKVVSYPRRGRATLPARTPTSAAAPPRPDVKSTPGCKNLEGMSQLPDCR